MQGLYVVSMMEQLKKLPALKTPLLQKLVLGGIVGANRNNSVLSNSISFDNYILASCQGQQVVGGAIGRINGNSIMKDCVCLENEMVCQTLWAKVLGGLVGITNGTPSISHSIYGGTSMTNVEGDDWHGSPHKGRFVGRNIAGGEKEQFCSNCVKVKNYLNNNPSETLRKLSSKVGSTFCAKEKSTRRRFRRIRLVTRQSKGMDWKILNGM